MPNSESPIPAAAKSGMSSANGAASANAAVTAGHGRHHRNPARIGCSGRQRKPSTAPRTVPAPITATSNPKIPLLPYSSSATVGPSVVLGPNESSSATAKTATVTQIHARERTSR
jgi:hypothetical protein